MRARTRRLIPWMVVLLLALPACQDDLEDEDISDNIPSMVRFEPLVGFSDVVDMETEDDIATAANECTDVIRADLVAVVVDANPRNTEATTFPNDVVLTSYTVQFTPLDAAVLDSDLPGDFTAAISQEIQVDTRTTFDIEIVRIQDKQAILDLACRFGPTAGSCGAVGAACGVVRQAATTVTFRGEDLAGKPVTLVGFLTIEFRDFADAPGPSPGLLEQ